MASALRNCNVNYMKIQIELTFKSNWNQNPCMSAPASWNIYRPQLLHD